MNESSLRGRISPSPTKLTITGLSVAVGERKLVGGTCVNVVEGFLPRSDSQVPAPWSLRSVEDLNKAIFRSIDHHNDSPLIAKAADILEKAKHARTALQDQQSA